MGLFLGNQLISPVQIVNTGESSSKYGVPTDLWIGNVNNQGVLQPPTTQNGVTFTGFRVIGEYALWYRFTDVSDAGLYFISGHVDLSEVEEVEEGGLIGAFQRNYITSIDLSSLTTVGVDGLNSAFADNQITSVSFPNLTTIGGSGLAGAFSGNQITSVSFPNLTTIGVNGLSYAFYYNIDPNTQQSTLQTVSFPALTSNSFEADDESAFDDMLSYDDGVTVHFPSNLQSIIENWQSVSNGFGGTNTIILYDLPATE